MNNKGFTLIELLITIALLGLILAISFVSINGIIEKSKVKDCDTLLGNIKSATSQYVSDNRYKNTNLTNITARMLIDNKYLKGEIYDPFNKKNNITDRITIQIELNSDYTVKNIQVSGIQCQ